MPEPNNSGGTHPNDTPDEGNAPAVDPLLDGPSDWWAVARPDHELDVDDGPLNGAGVEIRRHAQSDVAVAVPAGTTPDEGAYIVVRDDGSRSGLAELADWR